MNDQGPDTGKTPPSLGAALRSARAEAAERAQSMADLRSAEMARLDLLHDALAPVLAQVPDEVDLFDTGIVPGERPRLFIDMISFVDMARDRRTYRFHQDTRHGRVLLAETESLQAILATLTTYIARRLVEREKALASIASGDVALAPTASLPDAAPLPAPPMHRRSPRPAARLVRGLRVGLDGLGVLALAGLLWLGLSYLRGVSAVW